MTAEPQRCRDCRDPLTDDNARRDRRPGRTGRFVGACRTCESRAGARRAGRARKARHAEGEVDVLLWLPAELLEAIDEAADERVVGRQLLMVRLLEEGIDRLAPVERLTEDRRADLRRRAGIDA
jgi:hypothetical protein